MSGSFSPTEWICRTDPRTRRTYYINRRTGRSTWDPVLRTAVDTMPAADLYQTVVPVVGVFAGPSQLPSLVTAATNPNAAPQVVAVPSSSTLTKKSSDSFAENATSLSNTNNTRVAAERSVASETKGGTSLSSSSDFSGHSSTTTAEAQQNKQPSQPQPKRAQPPLNIVFPPPAVTTSTLTAATSSLSFRVPLSPSAAPSELATVKNATPLGTSPVQRSRSPKSTAAHQTNFLIASAAAPLHSPPPPDTVTRSPVEPTVSSLSASASYPLHPSHSPLGQLAAGATAESSTSFSSNQTQRPSDGSSFSSPRGSSSGHRQPPPLPLPALVTGPAGPGEHKGQHDSADASQREATLPINTTATATATTSSNTVSCATGLPCTSQEQQQQPQPQPSAAASMKDSFDQEAAAAMEWQLTQRTWELEGERARLESELAVLRGPVEVETQSIAEDHERLLAAQRALETAATLAVKQQQAKRGELEGLRQRLSELQAQRHNATFLLSTLQKRLDVVRGRCQKVQDEEAQLAQQRRELEEVVLPSEEAALRAAQHRLYEQRRRAAAQQQQLEEGERRLAGMREEARLLTRRLAAVQAISFSTDRTTPHDEANDEGHSVEGCTADQNGGGAVLPQRGQSAGSGALAEADVAAARAPAALTQRGRELEKRVCELRHAMAAVQSASRALYENKVLLRQERVLRAWTRRLRGEAETWQPAVEEARGMLRELKQFGKTQACKYGADTPYF